MQRTVALTGRRGTATSQGLVEVTATRRYPSPVLSEARHALPLSRWRAAAFILLVLALVGGGVGFLLLRGHGGEKPPGQVTDTGSPSAVTPDFDFKLLGSKPIPSSTSTSAKDLKPVADESAQEIATTLTRMYSLAFLDPTNWQKGDYNNVFGFFDLGKAQKKAARDASLLTLGTDAGKLYETVLPTHGTLNIQVLMDPSGNAFTAVAIAKFAAAATLKSGGTSVVVSKAQYFMHIQEGGWTIYGYNVERNDHPVKQSTSPSPEPTASAST
jgi:hypothetical protein